MDWPGSITDRTHSMGIARTRDRYEWATSVLKDPERAAMARKDICMPTGVAVYAALEDIAPRLGAWLAANP